MFNEERAHPIMIFTGFFKQLRGFLLPMIFAVSLQLRREQGFFENHYTLYFALAFLALSLVTGVLRWYFFTYSYKEGTLHIRSGVFVKKDRFIKKERVQTVSYRANVFYRLLNLVTLQVETAGGYKEPEVDIKAIDREKAICLREILKQSVKMEASQDSTLEVKSSKAEELPQEGTDTSKEEWCQGNFKSPVYRVGYRRLALAGLTSGGIGVIFSFIGVVFGQGIALVPEEWLNQFFGFFQGRGVAVVLFLVFIAFLLAWLISTLRFMIAYGDFQIHKGEKEIKIRRGLLEQKELSIKTHRIQGIRITEGLLRQLFGYATVQLEVAGGASQEDFKTTIHPLIHGRELQEFLQLVVPDRIYHTQLIPLPKRGRRRYWIRSLLPLLPLPLAFYLIPGNLIWLAGVILPLSVFFGELRYRDGAYRIEGDGLILQYRLFARTTVLLRRKQIQSLKYNTNWLQKQQKLTSVSVTILSAVMGADFTLKDLELEDAIRIYQWYCLSPDSDKL